MKPVIGWGLMLIVGVLLVFAGFTNRFGPLLAAIVAPADLAPVAGSVPQNVGTSDALTH